MNQLIEFQIGDGIARLVLNRPQKRNALSRQLIEELTAGVAEAARDESVRVFVLAAEGTVFCAGMDLGEMQARANRPDAAELWQQDTRVYRDLVMAIFQLPVPTLAVVQGAVLAGGVGLVAACDFVLAAQRASFMLPEHRRGISPAIVAPLVTYRIGPGRATPLLLSGRTIMADDAYRLGLCHEVAAAESLSIREREWIASVLTGASGALAQTKQLIIDCAASGLSAQIDRAMRVSAEARATPEAREGLAAFLEKRQPRWNPGGA